MNGYPQVIHPLDPLPRFKDERAGINSLAVWLLPNLVGIVFTVTLLQVLFLSAGVLRLFHDSDTGWHVRNGEAILSTAAVPRADGFSYTRDGAPWFAWEWLSDAVFGAVHRFAGLPGVAMIAALAIAVTVSGAAYLAGSMSGSLFFTAVATVLLLGTTSMHWLARPHVFSWILALVFLAVAERERRGTAGRALYLLPLVAALWANLHGSFLLGPAILFIYAIGAWSEKRVNSWSGIPLLAEEGWREARARQGEASIDVRPQCFPKLTTPSAPRFTRRIHPSSARRGMANPQFPRLTVASLACLLATFINPYGWRLHEHVLAYLKNDYVMDHISEFRS